MKRIFCHATRGALLLLVCAYCPLNAASPTISGIVNPAGNIPPGLPNYGIAEGSIFVVYGSGIGPSTLTSATALPLPSTSGLAGTSISVSVNGVTSVAPMLYSYQSQVAAILPSKTPVGSGTLTLTFNGQSVTAPLTVLASNFGISTVNQSGSGPGVVTFPNYSLVTAAKPAKPGDTVVIWGTGLGPITGSDDILPAPVDLGTPIQVYVGGVPATVAYRGRSGSPGLDQINIVIPPGLTAGCSVSLAIQTGNLVSNIVSLPIATDGGACSDPGGSQAPPAPATPGTYRYASFLLLDGSTLLTTAAPATKITAASAAFQQITIAPGASSGSGGNTSGTTTSTVSLGSCSVTSSVVSFPGIGSPGGTGSTGITTKGLNAGTVTLTPPGGAAVPLTMQSAGSYITPTGALSSLTQGTYRFSNGTGGVDVGPFDVGLPLAAPLVWTNSSIATTSMDRTRPLTLTWTGGDPQDSVSITLGSVSVNASTSSYAQSLVTCTAPVSAGQFTVPSYVLLSLIPNSTASTVSLSSYAVQTINLPGFDLAYTFREASFTVATPTTVFH